MVIVALEYTWLHYNSMIDGIKEQYKNNIIAAAFACWKLSKTFIQSEQYVRKSTNFNLKKKDKVKQF